MAEHFKTRYNEIDVEDVIEDYTKYKKSCYEISLDYRCSYGTIRRVLLKNKVKLRKSGRQKNEN